MAVITARNCPLCGVYIKPENLKHHIERVHSRFSEEAAKIIVDSNKCPICGNNNEASKVKFGLSICDKHYVRDIRPFLIKHFYVKLRERSTAELQVEPHVAFWMIKSQLGAINGILGWTPEELTDVQFLIFNEVSAFTGYLLLRLIESLPNIGEMMFSYAESKEHMATPKKFEQKVARLLMLFNAEFELFEGIKIGSTGYYKIAVDDEASPKRIIIVPSLEPDSINRLLLFLLRDANAQWHGTFRKVLVPYGTSTALDEFGAKFSFDRSLIKNQFDIFRASWNEVFETDTKMTADDFGKLWDWLEWVVGHEGVTENKQGKAVYFEDYAAMGLTKALVFETLRDVLPDVHDSLDAISLRELAKPDPYLHNHFHLATVARGFKVASPKGFTYYFPCRKWFYNKIMPVFVKFTKKLELSGPSFEKDISTISSFYSKSGISTGSKSALGLMIEPRLKEKSMPHKSSRSIPWRILEKNYAVELTDPNSAKLLGKFGEIDLVIYANMNLYLIELKSLNLEDRYSIKYIREKAPIQCAKYSAWVRDKQEFSKFLEEHKIESNQLNSVRIVVCSSGIFRDLNVTCRETGECFAIVSEFVLFSTFAGIFALSLKTPFPSRVEAISAGLKITNENVSQVGVIDANKKLREKISEKLILWTELITFDRRQVYEPVKVTEGDIKSANFFETGFVMNEMYLANTVSWILSKPLLIGKDNQYSFFLGTQLGIAGTTHVCENCKSAIKFYWPRKENKAVPKLEAIFAASKCPFCGHLTKESDETAKIRGVMTKLMAKFKYEMEEAFG